MTMISNSALVAFQTCPTLYKAEYVDGWQKPRTYLDFGHRFHQLLQKHYQPAYELPPTILDEAAENECQAMYEAYRAFYPTESFEVVECERRFELPVGKPFCLRHFNRDLELDGPSNVYRCPDCEYMSCDAQQHIYTGKFDMLVKDNETQKLQLFETKTEARGSKRNLPKAWVARTQGSLYVWAATQIFGEPIDSIILNVATKGSEKGRVGPSFRRDILQRTPEQVSRAISDLIYVADQIERLDGSPFPRNTNNCTTELGYECNEYGPCHFGIEHSEAAGFVHIEPFSYLSL